MEISIDKIQHPPLEDVDKESLSEIMESIKAIGLLHAISVLESEDGKFELLTGKKRLAAIKSLGHSTIEATVVKVAKDRAHEISLHENLMRTNLPWYEIVELEAEFHNLRLSQKGQRSTGRPRKGAEGGWSINETAKELGRAIGAISQDLQLAMILKLNPHLKNVQDKATALRLSRQIAKREEAEIAALDPGVAGSDILDQVFHGNSVDVLKMIPDCTYNLCITDPPWTQYKDDSLTADEDTLKVFKEIFRVLEYGAMLYAVVSTPDFYMYFSKLQEMGFKVQGWPLIWTKETTISHGRRGWEYARDYEPILVAAKGDPILTRATEPSSILQYKAVRPNELKHPHEKPIDLITQLIKDSTYEGARVLDPFGGSGVAAIASIRTRRKYTVVERNRKYYEQICRRVAAESAKDSQQELPGVPADTGTPLNGPSYPNSGDSQPGLLSNGAGSLDGGR